MTTDDFTVPPPPDAGRRSPRREATGMVLRWNALPLLAIAGTAFTLYRDGAVLLFMDAPVVAICGGVMLVVAILTGLGIAVLLTTSATQSVSGYGRGTLAALLGWVIPIGLCLGSIASGVLSISH